MTYLKKDQRYNEILKLAIQMAIKDGISSITVRQIAKKGSFSVGQIHHHFQSISQLKALALRHASDSLIIEIEQQYSNTTILEQLIQTVSPLEGEAGYTMRKLWNEAVFLAEKDNYIKEAYKTSLEEWHEAIVNLIEQGKNQNTLITNTPSTEIAWKLIALSCGLDSISMMENFRFEKNIIEEYIYQIFQIKTYPN